MSGFTVTFKGLNDVSILSKKSFSEIVGYDILNKVRSEQGDFRINLTDLREGSGFGSYGESITIHVPEVMVARCKHFRFTNNVKVDVYCEKSLLDQFREVEYDLDKQNKIIINYRLNEEKLLDYWEKNSFTLNVGLNRYLSILLLKWLSGVGLYFTLPTVITRLLFDFPIIGTLKALLVLLLIGVLIFLLIFFINMSD
jgi:hypothetical protein